MPQNGKHRELSFPSVEQHLDSSVELPDRAFWVTYIIKRRRHHRTDLGQQKVSLTRTKELCSTPSSGCIDSEWLFRLRSSLRSAVTGLSPRQSQLRSGYAFFFLFQTMRHHVGKNLLCSSWGREKPLSWVKCDQQTWQLVTDSKVDMRTHANHIIPNAEEILMWLLPSTRRFSFRTWNKGLETQS